MSLPEAFPARDIESFRRDGYVIVRGLARDELRVRLLEIAEQHLAAATPPLEYEADLQYPGAPASRDAPGGRTVRRLLQAYARDAAFRKWATLPLIAARLASLLDDDVELSQAHHNCVMTKMPGYSSATHWHRDIRYWSFERPELVSVWLALGREHVRNGCLLVLPGSHEIEVQPEQLDAAQFLRADCDENRELLSKQVPIELEPGDTLFFHSRLFHGAGNNQTNKTKYSVVFTYHSADNKPLPGSRSASSPDIPLMR